LEVRGHPRLEAKNNRKGREKKEYIYINIIMERKKVKKKLEKTGQA